METHRGVFTGHDRACLTTGSRFCDASRGREVMPECLVRVRTSNIKKAGTDARVFITLNGRRSRAKRRLDDKGNNFERGSDEHFVFQLPTIGRLESITLESDGSGSSPAWNVRDVMLRRTGDPKLYSFDVNAWISKDETLRRTIRPSRELDVQRTGGVLAVSWAAMIDNAEGPSGDPIGFTGHGPVGNLHAMVYEPHVFDDLRSRPHRRNYPTPLRHVILTGPTSNEWDDGDRKSYGRNGAELWRWRNSQDAVCLFVWESDQDFIGLSRRHDGVFLAIVRRRDTRQARVFASPVRSNIEFGAKDAAVARAKRRGGSALLRALQQKGAWSDGFVFGRKMPRGFLELRTVAGPRGFLPPRLRKKTGDSRLFGPI